MEMEVPAISFSEFVANYQGELLAFLTPVLLLVCWTLIMWLWMYATRIPAMTKAKIDPDDARHPGTYADRLPANVRAVADNYNHLHEQPTIFYALMVFAALTGGADGLLLNLAYGYVGIRVLHSLVQVLSPKVLLRFLAFAAGTIVLFVMAGKEVIRVFL
ncbi:MAG: MAPEG family protein [Pseudomonadota bacterium]